LKWGICNLPAGSKYSKYSKHKEKHFKLGGHMINEPAKNPGNKRVFLEANLSNWKQLSEEQKKEIVRRIYDGAVAGLSEAEGRKKPNSD
jgi:hypothetical protein